MSEYMCMRIVNAEILYMCLLFRVCVFHTYNVNDNVSLLKTKINRVLSRQR